MTTQNTHPAGERPEDGSTTLRPGQTFSHYQILEYLGGGGMSVVYRALDTKLDRFVALKFLPPEWSRSEEAKRRFIQEAKTASALDHPNVCTIYEIDETEDGQLYIAMAYYGEKTLKAKLKDGPLPIEEALRCAIQVAEGLSRAHEAGIVHRDIKPDNLIVTDRGRPKIVDFGIAKAMNVQLTRIGTTMGTVSYMSPEQARGEEVDVRTDLWSLGVVLYEMLTGQQPFKGSYEQAVIYSILNEEPGEMASVSPEVEQIVRKALAKNPDDRYGTAEDMAGDMRAIVSEPSVAPKTLVEWRHLFWLLAAAVVLGVGWYVFAPGESGVNVPGITSTRPLTNLPGLETSPAWSPDRTRIAYVSDESGKLDIWVHQLSSHQSVNLTPGRAGDGWHPAWSPDGEWIAFFSNADGGGVHLVPAIGAPPRRILEPAGVLDFESSLAWSPDGLQLLFSIGPSLYLAPAHGGEAEEVALPSEVVRWKIVDVSWAPGGERVTFAARAAAGLSTSTIWSVRPGGTDAVRVTTGATFDRYPVWAPDGDGIYFVSDRGGSPDLWYLPVDANGRPRGEAAALTVGAGVGPFALSPDGLQVSYSKQIERSNIWSMPVLNRLVTADDARSLTNENHFVELLALSPDGLRLAFDSDRNGNADIWTIGTDGRGLRQITSHPAHDWAPRWAPDGRRIGYHSLRSGNRDLWVQPVDGGTAKQLTDHEAQDWTISWSPDGETIVFGSGRSGAVEFWRMPATGGEAVQLTNVGSVWWYPVWSPDGTKVAFSSDVTGYAEIYLVSVDDGETRQLTNNRWHKGFPIAFSSDGSILFACGNTVPGLEKLDVWAISPIDGSARQLTDFTSTRLELFNAATDGKHIYATFLERIGDLWIVDLTH